MIGHNSRWAYYNEHDQFAAGWLRELMADGLIAGGEIDTRSIEDVTPDELRSFRQCHFFAGIGVWSLAARLAGVPDDAPLWTGSCPCQPFSQAGKGEGFDDERHLWPAFHYLIEQCRPPLVVGEQVAGADGDAWLDLVSADLDATHYAFGAAETCAAGFGAPHERSRNYWVAHALGGDAKQLARAWSGPGGPPRRRSHGGPAGRGDAGRLDRPDDARPQGHAGDVAGGRGEQAVGAAQDGPATEAGLPRRMDDVERDGRREGRDRDHGRDVRDVADAAGAGGGVADVPGRGRDDGDRHRAPGQRSAELRSRDGLVAGGVDDADGQRREGQRLQHVERGAHPQAPGAGEDGGVGHPDGGDAGDRDLQPGRRHGQQQEDGGALWWRDRWAWAGAAGELERAGPVNGLWRDADWLLCRDERWRPVESGTFPLADAGTFRNRVGLLRGAGNAVNAAQAAGFLVAVRRALGL